MIPNAPVRPRIAAAAVLRMPRPRSPGASKRRSLAHSQTVTGSSPASTQPVSRRSSVGELLGVGVGVDRGAGRGGEPDAVAALDELEDRAVGDAERLGDDRDGLVEQGLAVGDAERHAPEAAHRGLAAGALGLGGGAAGLDLGALVLDAQALAVGAAQLAREAVDHRADDDERHDRDEPVVDVDAEERVVVDDVVDADQQGRGEHALDDGVAQPEHERVRGRPEEEVREAVAVRAADEAEAGDEDGREGEQALQHGGGRVVGDAPDEQDAEGLGEDADREQRGDVRGPVVLEREPDLGHRGRADVEPPERTGHAAPVGRWAHGGFGDRQRNRFPRRLLRHPAGFLERGRTIRDVCPGGQTAKSAALKAVRSKGHCGFDSRPGYSADPACAPGPAPAGAAEAVGPQVPGGVATEVRSGRATGPPDGPPRGRTNVLL